MNATKKNYADLNAIITTLKSDADQASLTNERLKETNKKQRKIIEEWELKYAEGLKKVKGEAHRRLITINISLVYLLLP